MKKIIALAGLLIILIAGLGYGYWRFFYVPPMPNESGAKQQSYTWDYKGQKYTLDNTLYQSIDEYFNKRPKGIYQGLETRSIEKYLTLDQKSPETDEITRKIQDLAKAHNLNEDQTLELAVGFVQAIPYDETRARTDLTHPRYPYETLYEDKGICSDKTLLAVSVLKQLGYGTAVFMWDKEQHMAAAVSCPMQYSNYGTGYCIVETTAVGAKIGVVPDLSTSNLKAIGRSSIGNYGQTTQSVTNLGDAQIYDQKTGRTYQGVLARINIENEIKSIEQYLKSQKNRINSEESQLSVYKKQLDTYYSAKDYQTYNSLVPKYNALVAQVKADINAYNEKVNRYNYLIKQ